ncbi:MAG: undecaprenyl-diphosphate phosphatase [Planctomycetota bacterium]
MLDLLRAVVLGIIEGLTEFLPVSSTGHMILAMPALKIDPEKAPWSTFLYFIQIGAVLAIIIYFWKRLWRQLLRLRVGGFKNHLLTKLVVASIPAAAVGLPFNSWIEDHLEKPPFVALALILGAGVMEWVERRYWRKEEGDASGVTLRQAFLIGVAQCFSIIPGMSRAMSTIMGGLVVGLSPPVAAEFSFYLAIPTLLGAGLLKLVKHRNELHSEEAVLLGVGFMTAFVCAMLVVHPFMQFVKRRRLRPFAIYRVLLGAAVLAWWSQSR